MPCSPSAVYRFLPWSWADQSVAFPETETPDTRWAPRRGTTEPGGVEGWAGSSSMGGHTTRQMGSSARSCQRSAIVTGRHLAVVFDHGEDFMPALTTDCLENGVTQAFIPMFIAGFATAELVDSCDALSDPDAPLWETVHVEALGAGTIAINPSTRVLHPHIHTATGLKDQGAAGRTSHLVSARVQFLTELLLVESPSRSSPALRIPRSTTCRCCGSDHPPHRSASPAAGQPRSCGSRHGGPLDQLRELAAEGTRRDGKVPDGTRP